MSDLKLGKLPATPDAVKLKLATYEKVLPKIPSTFGHEVLMHGDVGMFGNDKYGDCVFAGAAHEVMLLNREVSKEVTFTDQAVLSDYSAVTGFDPSNPATDQGTDMSIAAAYRRKTGIVDANNQRHTVAAYLALEAGNLEQLDAAAYLFGAVGVGIQFPGSAMDQFNAGKPWSIVRGADIEGGHYVPLIAKRSHYYVVTWGRVQEVTAGFLRKYMDEAIVYLSHEFLSGAGVSPEGFKLADLQADLAAVTSAKSY
jgi:hypothetical protein